MILGAQTNELAELAGHLTQSATEIGGVRGETEANAQTTVEEMNSTLVRALTAVNAATDSLRTSVSQSHGRLNSTTWTGGNRDNFNQAYANFDASMHQLETVIQETYSNFQAQAAQISSMIQEFQTRVSAELVNAESATTSMSAAVNSQRENLEQVMNVGISA